MKRLLCVMAVLVSGCSKSEVPPGYVVAKKLDPFDFRESALPGYGASIQTLVYGGKLHVFLRSREVNTVSVVKVGEYPVEGEKR